MIKFIVLTYLVIISFTNLHAQSRRTDNILWPAVIITKKVDSLHTTFQVGIQNRYLSFGRDYQFLVGLAGVKYTHPKTNTSAGLIYAFGDVDNVGNVNLFQFYFSQPFLQSTLNLTLRPAFDRLWFSKYDEALQQTIPMNYRYRLFVGIKPKISKRVSWLINTEPFIYQNFGYFKEIRSTTGPSFKISKRLAIDMLYWHRWLNNSALILNEHALWLIVKFSI